MTRVVLAMAIFAAIPSVSVAQTDAEKARLGRTVWSAFDCAYYAWQSGDKQENDRLVDLGLKAGRGFLEAVKNKEIPEDVINREVPFVVLTLLQGPSLDFILGRVYEAATTNAADEVMKREGGKQLEFSQWISDKAVIKQKAANLFRDRNCALLK